MTDHKTLTEALVAFQAELPDVSKGGTNPAFKSKYATLPDVTKAVFPILTKHGLAWVTMPDETPEGHVLRWALLHTSGDKLEGQWPLPDAAKAQDLGSWITYGRRYTLSAVTGITPDEDDDGNAAQSVTRARRPQGSADKVSAAVSAAQKAADAAALDAIEDHAKSLGIAGIADVKAAIATARDRVGASVSLTDHWASKEVPS